MHSTEESTGIEVGGRFVPDDNLSRLRRGNSLRGKGTNKTFFGKYGNAVFCWHFGFAIEIFAPEKALFLLEEKADCVDKNHVCWNDRAPGGRKGAARWRQE